MPIQSTSTPAFDQKKEKGGSPTSWTWEERVQLLHPTASKERGEEKDVFGRHLRAGEEEKECCAPKNQSFADLLDDERDKRKKGPDRRRTAFCCQALFQGEEGEFFI